MNLRLKRLYADYKRVSQLFNDHPYITIKNVRGNPPERYQIEYRIKGLEQKGREIVEKSSHLVEIVLTRGYPTQEAPLCRMLTPVFHPNIAPHAICIADPGIWTPAESLADLIVRIGKIICYQSYNIKSPLNGEAARWVEENLNRLPIDDIDLNVKKRPEEIVVAAPEIEVGTAKKVKEEKKREEVLVPQMRLDVESKSIETCSNCGIKGKEIEFQRCVNGHLVCADCLIECQSCNKNLCVLCSFTKCSLCGKVICSECVTVCSVCSHEVCPECIAESLTTNRSDSSENICRACASKIKAEVKITYKDIESEEVDDILMKEAFYKNYKRQP
jgi:ubiquitin-protein ligase